MSADEFDYAITKLPEGKSTPADEGDDCPRCNQAEMESFGGKLRCPACFYLQPCCNP